MRSIYNTNNNKKHTECKMFLDDDNDGVTVLRFDQVKYPRILQFRDIQDSFFWRPQEISISKDSKDFKLLNDAEKHIFESNLFFQIMLDSVNTRAPDRLFGSLASLPEIQHFCAAWSYMESTHSFSYTWIIRNVYNNPTEVFDRMESIQEIKDRATDIIKHYDNLGEYSDYVSVNGYDNTHTKYHHKKLIWLALTSAALLEGLHFYISFFCSWAFAEQNKMVGNADIIKLISADEGVHLGFVQYLLKTLQNDDEDFAKIYRETYDECTQMYLDAIKKEKDWAQYLFKNGSMLGLNAEILSRSVDYLAKRRMAVIGYKLPYAAPTSDPLPWTKSWLNSSNVQGAPQERDLTDYLVGNLDKASDTENILKSLNVKYVL